MPPARPLTQPAEHRTRGATQFEVRLAKQLTGKNFCDIIIEGDLRALRGNKLGFTPEQTSAEVAPLKN